MSMRWNELSDTQREQISAFVESLTQAGWEANSWHKLVLAGMPCSPQALAELHGPAAQQSLSLELEQDALIWTVQAKYVAYMLRVLMPVRALEPWLALQGAVDTLTPHFALEIALALVGDQVPISCSVDGGPWRPLELDAERAHWALTGEPAAWELLSCRVMAHLESVAQLPGWADQCLSAQQIARALDALKELIPTLSWERLSEHFEALGLSQARSWSTLRPVWAPEEFGMRPDPALNHPLQEASPAHWFHLAITHALPEEDAQRPLEQLYDMALELMAHGRHDQPQDLLGRVLAARPAFAEAWHNLALVCPQGSPQATQALQIATSCYKAHVEHDPQDAYAWFWLASVQLASAPPNREAALESLMHAIELEPGYAREAMIEPDFEPLRQDPRFLKLVD